MHLIGGIRWVPRESFHNLTVTATGTKRVFTPHISQFEALRDQQK
jgi:hypothetical protein